MGRIRGGSALLAGAACGALVWGLSTPWTGKREPFDSASHYYIIAMFIAGAVAALPAPRQPWLAVLGIFLGERAYCYAMLPDTRPVLLLAFVVNLLILTWWSAALGAICTYLADRCLTRTSGCTRRRLAK